MSSKCPYKRSSCWKLASTLKMAIFSHHGTADKNSSDHLDHRIQVPLPAINCLLWALFEYIPSFPHKAPKLIISPRRYPAQHRATLLLHPPSPSSLNIIGSTTSQPSVQPILSPSYSPCPPAALTQTKLHGRKRSASASHLVPAASRKALAKMLQSRRRLIPLDHAGDNQYPKDRSLGTQNLHRTPTMQSIITRDIR